MNIDYENVSHRRYNPLTKSWTLCSPHRTKRPWLGQVEPLTAVQRPSYDPKCYLCPGNDRSGGLKNEKYHSTFVFVNDFPAVQPPEDVVIADSAVRNVEQSSAAPNKFDLFRVEETRGECHVICFHPRHDLTMAQMQPEDIRPVIETWTKLYSQMRSKPFVKYCQLFENKGEMMGCSNPHPHGQCWAVSQVPDEPRKEIDSMLEYSEMNQGCCLLCDYVKQELVKRDRIVCENEQFVCLVPWWAVWPFETMILSKQHKRNLTDLSTEAEQLQLADIIRQLACKYDNLFQCSFPYSMGLHQSPTYSEEEMMTDIRKRKEYDSSHLHMHYYPPLLRSATVRKFQTGYEMLANPQRDLTSEQAAKRLRDLPTVHYTLTNQK